MSMERKNIMIPHTKPINLIKELIKKYSNENDIVLDTFSDSNYRLKQELNRNYILIEKEKEKIMNIFE